MSRNSLALVLALVVAPVLPACAVDGTQGDSAAHTEEDVSLKVGKFETFVGQDGQHYFHFLAANGEKVLASEGYATLEGAQEGIASVIFYGTSTTRYELRTTKSGESYFVLEASNGEVLGVSETYASKSNAERGIIIVARIVKGAATAAAHATAAKFQLFKGLDSAYYFHVRAGNGEIVLQSEGYSARGGAVNGENSVRTNGADTKNYSVLEAADGQFYFVLKARNGQIIARGETYSSKSNAERGIIIVARVLAGSVASAS